MSVMLQIKDFKSSWNVGMERDIKSSYKRNDEIYDNGEIYYNVGNDTDMYRMFFGAIKILVLGMVM